MISKETGAEAPAEVATVAAPRQKPRRLISLQYNYSDSEEEESREERKARVVSWDFVGIRIQDATISKIL